MTLEDTLAAARNAAIEKHGHKCSHDFNDHRQMDEHQAMMAVLFKAMEDAEAEVRKSFVSPAEDEIQSEGLRLNTKRKTKKDKQ